MKKFDMKKFTFVLIGLNIFFFIFLSIYSRPKAINTINDNVEEREPYLNIIVTNKFIYSATKQIVKDKHNISYMFNNSSESLNYKFSADSLENVSKYDLFLYMGSSSEPWVDNFIDGLKKGKVGIVNLSRGTRTINYDKAENLSGYEIKINPYYWLSPDEYKIFLYNIKSAIQDKDPQNRDFYEENYNEVVTELDELSKEIKDASDSLKDYTIYTTDDELDYLNKYLGINVVKLTDENAITQYKDTLSQSSSKNLIIYSDETKFNDLKSKLVGISYLGMQIKVPEYNQNYKDYLKEIILKLEDVSDQS